MLRKKAPLTMQLRTLEVTRDIIKTRLPKITRTKLKQLIFLNSSNT